MFYSDKILGENIMGLESTNSATALDRVQGTHELYPNANAVQAGTLDEENTLKAVTESRSEELDETVQAMCEKIMRKDEYNAQKIEKLKGKLAKTRMENDRLTKAAREREAHIVELSNQVCKLTSKNKALKSESRDIKANLRRCLGDKDQDKSPSPQSITIVHTYRNTGPRPKCT